jgi:hypothetical protein
MGERIQRLEHYDESRDCQRRSTAPSASQVDSRRRSTRVVPQIYRTLSDSGPRRSILLVPGTSTGDPPHPVGRVAGTPLNVFEPVVATGAAKA